MRAIRMSKKDMGTRIARFARLKSLPIQNASIPGSARDVVYSRKLLSVIGLESETPINSGAPIVGAAGMTMTLAVCPPGQGPGLHAHRRTYETFTVLKGEFEVSWNDDGAESARLRRFDTISFPPGVCRAFRNVGRGEGDPAGDHHRRRPRHVRHRVFAQRKEPDRGGASGAGARIRESRIPLRRGRALERRAAVTFRSVQTHAAPGAHP